MADNEQSWRGRFTILEKAARRDAKKSVEELEKIYWDAEQSVQADLERWYGRFASNNGISLTDARKMLTSGQMQEFRWTVEQYIKAGQHANLSPEWLKKLENASARFRVSRLETIQLQIQQQMELLYGGQLDSLDRLLRKVVSNGYTHTAFEIQKGLGLGWDITALNQQKLETLLSRPWTADGKTFRDRCWENKANLISGVQSTLTQGILRGDSLQKITDNIKKQFGISRYKACRIAHTETTYFNGVANLEVYRDLGVEQIEILETLDQHTCEVCGALDGKVIPLSQYEPGVTVPPFHPNCRGTTCPYYEDMAGERAARKADGKVYHIPDDMTYEEWKKGFMEGGDKSELLKAFQPMENYRREDGSFDLETAIEDYRKFLQSAPEKNRIYLEQIMTAQVQALPEEQKQALQGYTGFAAQRINSAISQGRITPAIQKEIDLLDAALKDGVMPETVVLHRDTSFTFIAQKLGISKKPTAEELSKAIRRTITNDIFTSTSFENLGLPGRNTQIWLTVPAGYRGCQFIQSVAHPKFKNQIEVLFARGLQYKITDAKVENGKYVLFAEVLK